MHTWFMSNSIKKSWTVSSEGSFASILVVNHALSGDVTEEGRLGRVERKGAPRILLILFAPKLAGLL